MNLTWFLKVRASSIWTPKYLQQYEGDMEAFWISIVTSWFEIERFVEKFSKS